MKIRTNGMLLIGLAINLVLLSIFGLLFVREGAEANDKSDMPQCVPLDVEVVDVTRNSVKIEWKTNGDCVSYMEYHLYGSETVMVSTDSWAPSGNHMVELDDLRRGEVYMFYVVSNGVVYDNSGEPITVKLKSL